MNKKILFLIVITTSFNVLFSQTSWELLNPTPSASDGKNVVFVTNEVGYIITSNELLETVDSGTTWQIKQNIYGGNDISFLDGIGYVVGNNDFILKTDDNGANWQQIFTGLNLSFNSVNILDNSTIILSSSDKIIKTTDGGIIWSTLNIPNVNVVKTLFTSALVGHAICTNGKILKTIDGGVNWTITYTTNNIPSDFLTIHFVNENVGFATRQHSYLFKTINGGETWTEIGDAVGAMYDLHFLDVNNGFASGEDGAIYKTTNGGTTWIPIFFQNGFVAGTSMYGIYFHDINNGFATGARGRIIKTLNGGASWTDYSPNYNDFQQIQLINENVGYAKTGNSFFKTNNFGDTWSLVGTYNLSNFSLSSDFIFVNENLGFATTGGSDGGHIHKTTNGGATWSILNNGNPVINGGITAICFLNENTGFISGGNNQPKVMKTTNGGSSWTQVSNQIFGNIQFLNQLVGYGNRISNYFGAMYKTIDGGNTWNLSIEIAGQDIKFFHFVDENIGFFVGNNFVCYKTVDGGTSWQQLSAPYSYCNLVEFYSPTTGYITSENGAVCKTTNGGLNWSTIGVFGGINSIELVDNYIFLAGFNGTIYRSYTGILLLNLDDSQIEQDISIYPNPTNDYLNVIGNATNQLESIVLFDTNGKIVEPIKSITNESLQIEMSSYSSGIYFLKLNFANNKSITKKIIVKK